MDDDDIDEVLEEQGISKENLVTALELARLVSEETGLCCAALGRFIWVCYRRLEADEE